MIRDILDYNTEMVMKIHGRVEYILSQYVPHFDETQDPVHGIKHHRDTCLAASTIAYRIGLRDDDMMSLHLAAAMHDCSLLVGGTQTEHHTESADILRKGVHMEIDEDLVHYAVWMIETHRDSSLGYDNPLMLADKILLLHPAYCWYRLNGYQFKYVGFVNSIDHRKNYQKLSGKRIVGNKILLDLYDKINCDKEWNTEKVIELYSGGYDNYLKRTKEFYKNMKDI